MLDRDPRAYRPEREVPIWTIVVAVVVLFGAGLLWWRWHEQQQQPEPPPVAATTPQPDMPPAEAPKAEPQGPRNPIEAVAEPEVALPALDSADARVTQALAQLLGQKQLGTFLQVDGFVRRAVATVDNLPRGQAPSRMWPVQPAPERFSVEERGGSQTIAAANAARYGAFVRFIEAVDTEDAVTLYARFYPLFQQAYEELGYPGRYFNDRLVAVLDHLLQAPEPDAPPAVELVEVRGEMASTRPWVRYEFVDPKLEALSSGQKMMVRVGPDNERRLKAKLAELRRQIATGAIANKK